MLSTQRYKGTRDFYPEDFARREYIFGVWRNILVANGFSEFDASLLENAEMYITKSGEELGTRQLYSFTDKGNRRIALRPEMTPTIARMVAAKFGELSFPLRWFTIPNCFRYERPQKGRLREFWQLNADIIGLPAGGADLELLILLGKLFQGFGAPMKSYTIRFNHRGLLDDWIHNELKTDETAKVYDLLDGWRKMNDDQRDTATRSFLNDSQVTKLLELVRQEGHSYDVYVQNGSTLPEFKMISELLIDSMPEVDYQLDPTIVRGLAYYTGIVFEAFDNNPENPRALFGGGRYDSLLDMFGESAPAIGFGWGDVTMEEFLNNWDLWPEAITQGKSSLHKTGIMVMDESHIGTIFSTVIPTLISEGKIYDIDYNVERNENKRYTTLKKRGCSEILKI